MFFFFPFNILSSPLMGFFLQNISFFHDPKNEILWSSYEKKITLIMAQEMFQENGLPAPYVPQVKDHITVCKNNLSVYTSILLSVYTSILLSVYCPILSSVYDSISNESRLISLMMMCHSLKPIHLNIFKVKDASVFP